MKVKLKFSDSQFYAFATIVKYVLNSVKKNDFESIQYADALTGLLFNLIKRMTDLKEKNSITLTEIEALALYNLMSGIVDNFKPYEKCIIYKIFEEIDTQKHMHLTLKMKNLSLQEQNKIEGYGEE